jgi:hypothetical protein
LITVNGGLNFDDENFMHGKKTWKFLYMKDVKHMYFLSLLLLEWQITHDITNIAMTGIFKLMRKELGLKKLPKNHYEAKSKLKMLGLKV